MIHIQWSAFEMLYSCEVDTANHGSILYGMTFCMEQVHICHQGILRKSAFVILVIQECILYHVYSALFKVGVSLTLANIYQKNESKGLKDR